MPPPEGWSRRRPRRCPNRSAGSATGTTATPGSAMRRSGGASASRRCGEAGEQVRRRRRHPERSVGSPAAFRLRTASRSVPFGSLRPRRALVEARSPRSVERQLTSWRNTRRAHRRTHSIRFTAGAGRRLDRTRAGDAPRWVAARSRMGSSPDAPTIASLLPFSLVTHR